MWNYSLFASSLQSTISCISIVRQVAARLQAKSAIYDFLVFHNFRHHGNDWV